MLVMFRCVHIRYCYQHKPTYLPAGFLSDVIDSSLEMRHYKGNSPKLIQLTTCLKSVELLPFITYRHLKIVGRSDVLRVSYCAILLTVVAILGIW